MPGRLVDTRLLNRFAIVAITVLLAACSSTDTYEQPAELPEVVESVELNSVWNMTVGDGHDEGFLYLEPLFTGDQIYAVSADGELYAVEPENGKVAWYRQLDQTIMAGVGGDNRRLYLVTRDARLLALSREDGRELWSARLPNEVLAAPSSNGFMVVAQSIDGKVHAFSAEAGEKLWQYDSAVPVLSLRAAASPMVGADLVLASLANGRLLALAAENGQPVWQYQVGEPQGRSELERLVDIAGKPLILETAAMVVGYQGKLAMVDVQTGREIWSREASSLNSPAISKGNIYVSSANGEILALRGSDRREIWKQDKLAWRQLTQPLVLKDYLIVGDFEGYLHILSTEDGSFLGQRKFDSKGLRVPFIRLAEDRVLVFGNSGKLSVLELEEDDTSK